jgi:hypothetical protein
LEVKVNDGYDSITFVIFDPLAERLRTIRFSTTRTNSNDQGEGHMASRQREIIPIAFYDVLNRIARKVNLPMPEYGCHIENNHFNSYVTIWPYPNDEDNITFWGKGDTIVEAEMKAVKKAIKILKARYNISVNDINWEERVESQLLFENASRAYDDLLNENANLRDILENIQRCCEKASFITRRTKLLLHHGLLHRKASSSSERTNFQ